MNWDPVRLGSVAELVAVPQPRELRSIRDVATIAV
jgi:hypothetical protein